MDRLAKENICTLAGSGYQDVFWDNLISVLAGASRKIVKIEGMSSYNIEDKKVSKSVLYISNKLGGITI